MMTGFRGFGSRQESIKLGLEQYNTRTFSHKIQIASKQGHL